MAKESSYSDFDALASYAGDPAQFWPKLCLHAKSVFQSQGACLLLKTHATGSDSIRMLAQDSARSTQRVVQSGVVPKLDGMKEDTLHSWTDGLLVIVLPVVDGPKLWLILLDAAVSKLEEMAREVRVLAESYQARRREMRVGEQVISLSEVLDLGVDLGKSTTFSSASLRLCHRVAAVIGAARVSLGWLENGSLQLKATSHGGRITASMQETESLLRVMEEAADQNNEIAYPSIEGSQAINHEHKLFTQSHQGCAVLSIPFRNVLKHDVVGVLMLERAAEDGGWRAVELEQLRLAVDLVAPRLSDLYAVSGWWGLRAWRFIRLWASNLIGIEHTGWKLAGLTFIATVMALALIQVEHKVKAPFLLKTDAAALAAAPFPGFIDDVYYHLGDEVKAGQVLLTLDRRELLLDEANGLAGRDKFDREARAYEAQGKLAESLIAKADQRQNEAKLNIVRHRLSKTEVKAPFDGVVVEGDMRERLASPVHLGESLFKIVQLRDLLGQLQVDERDIGYLHQGQVGELAFASRPYEKFQVKLERFEPVAEVRQEGNIFVLRVQILSGSEDWWRPGMSGICKLNTGKRSLLWVLMHRTVETLRLWLWL